MAEIQTFEAAGGVLPYLFLQDHRAHSKDDIAGLKVAVGDQLAETFMNTQQAGKDPERTAITRRATAQDLANYKSRHERAKAKTEPMVAIEFETDVGTFRGPTKDRKADVAGFPPRMAKQYCEGYLDANGKKVGGVAHLFVDPKTIDTKLDPEIDKPRKAQAPRKTKRQKAALGKSPRTADVK